MKKCPFCAEEIQDAAIVCKHCGRSVARRSISQVGVFLMVVAVTTFIYAVAFFDTSVGILGAERRVQNLGLMQNREVGIVVSLVLAAVAAVALWKWPRHESTPSRRTLGWTVVGVLLAAFFTALVYVHVAISIVNS